MYSELKRMICPQCKEEKDISKFGKDITAARGVSCWCKLCKKLWRSEHRQQNKEKYKYLDFANDIKRRYNLTVDEYNRMYDEQNGCCACCNQSSTLFKNRLHVDHSHTTGQVRGLLCTQCNPGIGYFQESIERLEMAITYLKKFKK